MHFAEASSLIGPLEAGRQPPLYATYQEIILRVSCIHDYDSARPCVFPVVNTCSRIYDGCRMHRAYTSGDSTRHYWMEWEE